MNSKNRKTLSDVFADPLRAGVPWADIEALLEALGAEITEGNGSRVRIALNGVRAVFHRPHPQREALICRVKVAGRVFDQTEDHPMKNTMTYCGYMASIEFEIGR
ncbi:MAG: type II toxin-antitoxin system HicA family toxin, partial [Nitrospirales bacterium]|nr:type II toxin-antitoxin system HicA family toxin [Nitrospirales bacterium]